MQSFEVGLGRGLGDPHMWESQEGSQALCALPAPGDMSDPALPGAGGGSGQAALPGPHASPTRPYSPLPSAC